MDAAVCESAPELLSVLRSRGHLEKTLSQHAVALCFVLSTGERHLRVTWLIKWQMYSQGMHRLVLVRWSPCMNCWADTSFLQPNVSGRQRGMQGVL